MKEKKKSKSMENEIILIFRSLKFTLSSEVLTNIFRDLLWGIIRFKEKKLDDSLKNFREFVEHSHRFLFNNLNPLLQNPIILQYKEQNDKKYVEKLKNDVFPELNIKNVSLLEITRATFKNGNIYVHEIIPEYKKPIDKIPLLKVINNCIRLFLLIELIANLPKQIKTDNKKVKDIYKKYPTIFKKKTNNEILEIFLYQIFSTQIRDLIFERQIITTDHIKNSKILQKYYPFITIERFKIQIILDSKKVVYFRPDGPHLIDFKKGNWVFIPVISDEIISNLKKRKNILLEGQSGTGKTIISRFIGYNFLENSYQVFYFNFLECNPKEIHELIEYLIYFSHTDFPKKILFIFENIHAINKETLKRLAIVKEYFTCLFTRRIFSVEEDDGDYLNFFSKDEIKKIDIDSKEFEDVIRGILEINTLPDRVITNLILMDFKNLWMLGIFLKLTIEEKDKVSFFDILTDFEKLEGEITKYFKTLMESKHLTYSSSEKLVYLNHLKYLISIIAIFSDLEIWTEAPFIYSIFEIDDDSVFGEINRNINYDRSILKQILSFLIDIFEIKHREGKSKKSLSHFEYSIPHSQMARIYKNSILHILEEDYKGLTENIIYHYIFTGKFYGTYLYKTTQLIYSMFYEDYRERQKELDDKYESFYLMLTDPTNSNYYADGLKLLKKQILERGIDEAQWFLDSLPYKCDGKNILYRKFYELIFNDEGFLSNENWSKNLLDSDYKGIFYFIREIQEVLGDEKFEKFISQFSEEIINQFEESDELQLINLLILTINCSQEVWNKYYKSLKRFLINKKIDFDTIIKLDGRASKKLDKINQNHPKYSNIKEIFLESFKTSSMKEDIKFLYNYERYKLFIDIFLEFLQNASNEEIIKNKVRELNLFDYTTLITSLNNINPSISKEFFKKYHQRIKNKIQDADHSPLQNFLGEIQYLEYDKELLKNILLEDWTWFIDIIKKFKYNDLILISTELKNFFKNLFPEYLDEFEKIHLEILKSKIDTIFEELPIKKDIINLVDEFRFKGEINQYILKLFENSLINSLTTQDFKFYLDIFEEIYNKRLSRNYIVENFDFKGFISQEKFKKVILKADIDDIAQFYYLLKYSRTWYEIFNKEFGNHLEARFGVNYEDILSYNRTGRLFLEELPIYIQNLEIEKLNLIYFSTFNQPEDILFIRLCELIYNNYELFLGELFQEKISSLNINSILNFLILLNNHHSSLLEKIKKEFKEQIKSKFELNPLEVENILSIFIILKINASYLQKLDKYLFNEPVIFFKIIETFQSLDLFTFRYILDYFINSGRFDDISEIAKRINVKKMIEISTFLEISLAFYFYPLNLVREGSNNDTPRYLLGQYNITLNDKLFLHLTRYEKHLVRVNISRPKRLNHFALYGYNKIEKEIILKEFNPYSKIILSKMKEAPFVDIISFFHSLISLKNVFPSIILNAPDEFYDFLYSNCCSKLLQNEDPENTYNFFRVFSFFDSIKARKLWNERKNIIETNTLLIELDLNKIFELFYFAYYENYNSIPTRSLKFLKTKVKEIKFHELMQVLLIIDYVLLEVVLSLFENEIKEKVLKLSKFEVLKEFEREKNIMFKPIYRKQLDLIKKKIPVIQKKLDEKYIHE